MAQKLFRVKLYRESGELEELLMQATDIEVAIYNAEKAFDRAFEFVGEENGYLVLEEKLNG